MTFFNKKEEVLEIKLTSYGKDKLAKGKFKPTYYAFFDDDILYDAARGGISEDDNNIEPRIQDNSPSLRVQTSFSDLEKKVKKQKQIANVESLNQDSSIFEDYDGLRNVLPIGNSQLGNQNVASWRVELLNAECNTIRASINNDLSKKPIINIPQMDLDMTVTPYLVDKDFIGVIDPKTEKFIVENNGMFIRVEDDYLVLDVSENNVDLLNDAFSLEVYEVVLDENNAEILKPKMFKKQIEEVVDGILLDEKEIDAQISLVNVDNRFSEYYFDVTADSGIDNKTKKDNIDSRMKKGSIFDKTFQSENTDQNLGGRSYTSNNDGEDC